MTSDLGAIDHHRHRPEAARRLVHGVLDFPASDLANTAILGMEVSMLFRKMQEPLAAISKETRQAEESLFLRLEELARNRPFLFDCSVQQVGDDEFVMVLLDHDSGAEVCAWTGAADGIVVEFEAWLDKKYPRARRA